MEAVIPKHYYTSQNTKSKLMHQTSSTTACPDPRERRATESLGPKAGAAVYLIYP